MDRIHSVGTTLLGQYGIDAYLRDVSVDTPAEAWLVPSGSGQRELVVADGKLEQAQRLLGYKAKQGASAAKVAKRLKTAFTPAPYGYVGAATQQDADGTIRIPLHRGEIRVVSQPSELAVCDGTGAARYSATERLIASCLTQATGAPWAQAVQDARKALVGRFYLQHFTLTGVGGTKGLLWILPDDEYDALHGRRSDFTLDSENVKGEIALTGGHTLIRAYLRRPFDNPRALSGPIAEITELGVGWDWRQQVGDAEATRVMSIITRRVAEALSTGLEKSLPPAEVSYDPDDTLPWGPEVESSVYAMPAEKGVVPQWTGALYPRTKGKLPTQLGWSIQRGVDTRSQLIGSAIGAYLLGDGRYLGEATPADGYVSPVVRGKTVCGWIVSALTLADISQACDTPDSDGDYVLGSLRTYPDKPGEHYLQITRFPQSPGGGAILRLTDAHAQFLLGRGMIPSPIIGDTPLGHWPSEGVYTLVPVPADSPQASSIGAIYNLASVLKIIGGLDIPVTRQYREAMAAAGIEIPQARGLRTNFSTHGIDDSGDKRLMVAELENALFRAICRDGRKIDACLYPRVAGSIDTIRRRYAGYIARTPGAAELLDSAQIPCEGACAEYNGSIRREQGKYRPFEQALALWSNGPLSLLRENFADSVVESVYRLHGAVAAAYAAKIAADNRISKRLHWRRRRQRQQDNFVVYQNACAQLCQDLFESLALPPGKMAAAVIQGAALDRRRFGPNRRPTQINHLLSWATRTADGEAELAAYKASREVAGPTALVRLTEVSDTLAIGSECRVRAIGEGGELWLTQPQLNDDGEAILLARVRAGGSECQGRLLVYQGLAADGDTDILSVMSIRKTE